MITIGAIEERKPVRLASEKNAGLRSPIPKTTSTNAAQSDFVRPGTRHVLEESPEPFTRTTVPQTAPVGRLRAGNRPLLLAGLLAHLARAGLSLRLGV
jgi:hypothetical protein